MLNGGGPSRGILRGRPCPEVGFYMLMMIMNQMLYQLPVCKHPNMTQHLPTFTFRMAGIL